MANGTLAGEEEPTPAPLSAGAPPGVEATLLVLIRVVAVGDTDNFVGFANGFNVILGRKLPREGPEAAPAAAAFVFVVVVNDEEVESGVGTLLGDCCCG